MSFAASSTTLLLFGIALLLLNIIGTFIILGKSYSTLHKLFYTALIWFLPFFGLFVVFILDNFTPKAKIN